MPKRAVRDATAPDRHAPAGRQPVLRIRNQVTSSWG